MMKFFCLVLIMFCVYSKAFTQTKPASSNKYITERMLVDGYSVVKAGNKKGVIKNGKIILPPTYKEIYSCDTDLFVVAKDENKGVVSAANNIVLPFQFSEIRILSPERFIVTRNAVSVIVNEKNLFIAEASDGTITSVQDASKPEIEPIVEEQIEAVKETTPVAKPQQITETDQHNQAIEKVWMAIPGEKENLSVKKGDKVVKTTYNYFSPLFFPRDYLYVYKKGEKFGVVNNKLQELTGAFYEKLFAVPRTNMLLLTKDNIARLYQLKLGKLVTVLPDTLESVEAIDSNRIVIRKIIAGNYLQGVINSNGQYLLKPSGAPISSSADELTEVSTTGANGFNIVDKNMKSILPAGTIANGIEGNYIFLTDGKDHKGVMHKSGYLLIPVVYDEFSFVDFLGDENTVFKAKKNGKWV